jgi:UDP-N-acetylmuramyl pentapeptide phosphotransferase/UDP-N-acetylglucosamine-1-phosphate transferase
LVLAPSPLAAQYNQCLTSLDLASAKLNPAAAAMLGAGLGFNHALTTLRLARNMVGDAGAIAIAAGIAANSALRVLNFDANEVWCLWRKGHGTDTKGK